MNVQLKIKKNVVIIGVIKMAYCDAHNCESNVHGICKYEFAIKISHARLDDNEYPICATFRLIKKIDEK